MSSTPSLPNSSQTPVHSSSLSDSQPKKKQKVESSPDVKANTPQTKISSDISQTLSLFECCVCLEYINPPILQCQNSHVFCQSCRQKFKTPVKCPTCRVVLLKTDIRSYLLEQIAESLRLPFPCKYKTNGCDVTSLLTEIPKHQNECEFVPYRCTNVIFEDCQWSDSRQEVAQHLIDEHKYPMKYSGFLFWKIKLDEDMKNSWATISSYKNQNFIFIVRFDSENKYIGNNKIVVVEFNLIYLGNYEISIRVNCY